MMVTSSITNLILGNLLQLPDLHLTPELLVLEKHFCQNWP